MRDWSGRTGALEAHDARLLSLSTDKAELIATFPEKFGLTGVFARVEPQVWVDWGIANPQRPGLPAPTTLVIAPNGTILFQETHADYKRRSSPDEVLALITAHKEQRLLLDASMDSALPEEPDWTAAVTVTAARTPTGARVVLQVEPGYHVYGARETSAQPLAIRIAGAPASVAIPPGTAQPLGKGLSDAWVLDGTIPIDVATPKPGTLTGELDLQICTLAFCSPPTTRVWTAQ